MQTNPKPLPAMEKLNELFTVMELDTTVQSFVAFSKELEALRSDEVITLDSYIEFLDKAIRMLDKKLG